MTRIGAVLAALGAVLLLAPAASAAGLTYVVNDPGSATDATALAACTNAQPGCTLPAAITDSNASPGADTITFSGAGTAPGPFSTPLPAIADPVTVDGGGNTTVTFDGTAVGPLVPVQAGNTMIKSIAFTGGASGVMVNLNGVADQLNAVSVQSSPTTAVRVGPDSARLDGVQITNVGGTGIQMLGSNATISSPVISGAGGDGITVSGNGDAISGGAIHNNAGNGVSVNGQNDSVNHVVFYGNGGKPIADQPGANGGIAPPQNLRIGPRRSDGSLPLTGTSSAGTIELWSGDPFSGSAPSFLDSIAVSGDFTYNFANEPQPGAVFAASLTSGGVGTSEFVTVRVPDDISSPMATFSRALDTQNVRVDFSEPLNPGSVQASEFHLSMAGQDRMITGATVAPDGLSVTLATTGGWKAGEAGAVDLPGAATITDLAGNAMTTTPRLRVAAAPGDFIAPIAGKLAVSPGTICLTHARTCRRPGMTIRFTTTEPGKATLVIMRSDVIVGKRLYGNIVAGANALSFNGVLGARKLRAGRYRLLMYVQDMVGNITDNPPIVLFNVRRTTH